MAAVLLPRDLTSSTDDESSEEMEPPQISFSLTVQIRERFVKLDAGKYKLRLGRSVLHPERIEPCISLGTLLESALEMCTAFPEHADMVPTLVHTNSSSGVCQDFDGNSRVFFYEEHGPYCRIESAMDPDMCRPYSTSFECSSSAGVIYFYHPTDSPRIRVLMPPILGSELR